MSSVAPTRVARVATRSTNTLVTHQAYTTVSSTQRVKVGAAGVVEVARTADIRREHNGEATTVHALGRLHHPLARVPAKSPQHRRAAKEEVVGCLPPTSAAVGV